MLDEEALRNFVLGKPPNTELVITGRNPPAWLIGAADYITEMKKHKHPYDRGILAREAVEY
jgi:cob(I)alamin adenosyltransferase